ncbi:unnamed protein product [Heligmosomoides polygyrus]|uniref:Uncharacterized protein n=1 Tax=Heligmosomoides polygyrus TaxID=6339 RepID=A0A183FZ78_HELPZ|nr:unnamed protein product [Heligmosomoides polygyrus]
MEGNDAMGYRSAGQLCGHTWTGVGHQEGARRSIFRTAPVSLGPHATCLPSADRLQTTVCIGDSRKDAYGGDAKAERIDDPRPTTRHSHQPPLSF